MKASERQLCVGRWKEGLVNNDTFIISKLPSGRTPVTAKWANTWKSNHVGEVVKGKAHLVPEGFMQNEGVHYLGTSSSTPVSSPTRTIAVAAVRNDWTLSHWYMEHAFVQSKIDGDIFLKTPEGCVDIFGEIVKLNRSYYGLRLPPTVFNKLLVSKRLGYGLEKFTADPRVFRLRDSEGKSGTFTLGAHVDDFIVMGDFKSGEALREYLNKLSHEESW